ncbi:MAG TPA: hypothetical protein VFQ43_07705 [Nitrososphaera sp.]|nr:hypothetical protein [Nitrososphaera sp.]
MKRTAAAAIIKTKAVSVIHSSTRLFKIRLLGSGLEFYNDLLHLWLCGTIRVIGHRFNGRCLLYDFPSTNLLVWVPFVSFVYRNIGTLHVFGSRGPREKLQGKASVRLQGIAKIPTAVDLEVGRHCP